MLVLVCLLCLIYVLNSRLIVVYMIICMLMVVMWNFYSKVVGKLVGNLLIDGSLICMVVMIVMNMSLVMIDVFYCLSFVIRWWCMLIENIIVVIEIVIIRKNRFVWYLIVLGLLIDGGLVGYLRFGMIMSVMNVVSVS